MKIKENHWSKKMINVFSPLRFYCNTKKKNINENGSLKWAVAALYVIYGMLNFWSYYKLARLCKTQHKQNSSEYKFFSL